VTPRSGAELEREGFAIFHLGVAIAEVQAAVTNLQRAGRTDAAVERLRDLETELEALAHRLATSKTG